MAVFDFLKIAEKLANKQPSKVSFPMREKFQEWLVKNNVSEYSPDVLMSNVDTISEYAFRKSLSTESLWKYTEIKTFELVYQKLLAEKLLRLAHWKMYKRFLVSGELYLRFLREKTSSPSQNTGSIIDTESTITQESKSQEASRSMIILGKITDLQPNQDSPVLELKFKKNDILHYLPKGKKTEIRIDFGESQVWQGTINTEHGSPYVHTRLRGDDGREITCTDLFLRLGLAENAVLHFQHEGKGTLRLASIVNPGKWRESNFGKRIGNLGFGDTDIAAGKKYSKTEKITGNNHSFILSGPDPSLVPVVVEKVRNVLMQYYTNGFRLNSPIELARFNSFAAESLRTDLMLPDDELEKYISASGTTYAGKVYPVLEETKIRIKENADDYFAKGAQIIFFTEFYAKNMNWLYNASVVAEDMLIGIFREMFPTLSFTQTYFSRIDFSLSVIMEREILRVWGNELFLTYDQLAERLQFIPLERIKSCLAQNADFIWTSMETYSHIKRIHIEKEECETIRQFTAEGCNSNGYVSALDLPIGEIRERNHELSITAVHNAVFRICLSGEFDKIDKIITKKGETLNALTIMKDYCRALEKCTLDDLLNFERELVGEKRNRGIPLEAGYSVLVRIDRNAFVAEKYVRFDPNFVDEAIAFFVTGNYLPLKSFTTFAAFPDCGQPWNLFLLESYCRRFSRIFRFDAPFVNSRNAGAVIRKSCSMNYTEIMAHALAAVDIPLKNKDVGNFLFKAGYTGRSTTSKVKEIIEKAKAFRERRS